jgi:hypothetical protein
MYLDNKSQAKPWTQIFVPLYVHSFWFTHYVKYSFEVIAEDDQSDIVRLSKFAQASDYIVSLCLKLHTFMLYWQRYINSST